VRKEDHTLGNMVRYRLLDDGRVVFGGYRMPHPHEHELHIKIRTRKGTEPHEALVDSIQNLSYEFRSLSEQFQAAVQNFSG
jgi:DNA-directed RNA polymerase II subunit RPB11